MKARALFVVAVVGASLVAFAGCGAGSSLDFGSNDQLFDANCDPDGEAGAMNDGAMTDGPPIDAVFLDHGTNGANPDAALSRCASNEDCDGWATCQSGLCCSGLLVGTVCMCGDGPGCDLRSACCVPFTSTTMKNECVTDCEATCGCATAK
jgi:hypothetical protein